MHRSTAASQVCVHCGTSFNIADINDGEYVMPPLLPKDGDCPRGPKGNHELVQRDDDLEDVVKERLRTYQRETAPLVDFYRKKVCMYVCMNEKKVRMNVRMCEKKGMMNGCFLFSFFRRR
eukprot:GHVU01124821.1.p2 GENE.GHVU01124821.1~~GHVU01124821.1.p2  ORF type:complete len:120 (+),score=21.70 GHVU01124821.1:675-1034(+)